MFKEKNVKEAKYTCYKCEKEIGCESCPTLKDILIVEGKNRKFYLCKNHYIKEEVK